MRRTQGKVRRRGRLFRLAKRLLQAALLVVSLCGIYSCGFIGFKCYGASTRAQAPSLALQRVGRDVPGFAREEASTYLTLPEWYIVYNTEEYARFLGSQRPSAFPYIGSVRQYWRYYGSMCDATRGVYPFSGGNHLMLAVIGSSFTIEYALKGLYENTVGRITEAIGGRGTPEDVFSYKTAVEYGTFMHTVPWYEFPFFSKTAQLWRETPATGPQFVRKWERKLALTGEYVAKGIYGAIIGFSSGATYGTVEDRIYAWIDNAPDQVFTDGVVKKVHQVGPRSFIVTIPRYEAFTTRAMMLMKQNVRFLEIGGNDEILITVLQPDAIEADQRWSVKLDEPLLTDPATKRMALSVMVRSLHETVLQLEKTGATIEHIYDY